MQCDYFDAGVCRSCTRMGQPYAAQLADKDARVREIVGVRPSLTWEEPFASDEAHFRAKAKMVVGGTTQAPTLGILDADDRGVDLRGCGLLGPAAAAAMPRLAEFVTAAGLRPYDVPTRNGELKYLHVLEAHDAGLLVRFVLRSEGQVGRLRRHLPELQAAVPGVRVVTVNLLPEHKAAPEGEHEIVLTDAGSLPMHVGDVTLDVYAGAFIQTNTAVAAGLYRQAAAWIADAAPATVLDLYCGVGGFALHAARALGGVRGDADPAPQSPRPDGQPADVTAGAGAPPVVGVEVSAQAVASARRAAASAGVAARFEVGDATRYAEQLDAAPSVVVVNPPRRGIGARLATWLDGSDVTDVVYSSCNPVTLARDLDALPHLHPVRARLFDMFPQTDHAEVLVHLRRG